MINKDLLDISRITNSPSISGGGYCISAEQLNPDIEGSLRSDINKLKDLDPNEYTKHRYFRGIDGESGYLKVADITLQAVYDDSTLFFEIGGRSWDETATIFIKTTMGSNYPGIWTFTYRGHLYSDVVLCKITDYNYHLYVKKTEPYSWVSIIRWGHGNIEGKLVKFEEIQVSTLPNSGMKPTLAPS